MKHCTTANRPPGPLGLMQSLLLALLLLLTLPVGLHAQLSYITNNGAITITGYTGPGGGITIPDNIGGLPVTSIADYAFSNAGWLTGVTIPSSVSSIGMFAFAQCTSLTDITLPNGLKCFASSVFLDCSGLTNIVIPDTVTIIGSHVFEGCTSLKDVIIPNGVGRIDSAAFDHCINLTNIVLGDRVRFIGYRAFQDCINLTTLIVPRSVSHVDDKAFSGCKVLRRVFFQGDAPEIGSDVFLNAPRVVVNYMPGTAGWGSTLGGRPTQFWVLRDPLILNFGANFGVGTNRFGFIVSWARMFPVVVEASPSLGAASWEPISTNVLTDGWFYFSDPVWTNHSTRLYRVRSQ